MGDYEAGTPGIVESLLEYHPLMYLDSNSRDPEEDSVMVGSLTGVVASKRVTEAPKGPLRTVGNRA